MHCVEITDGVVTNIVVCDDLEFATTMKWVDVDAMAPRPGIGWTTADGGQTFDPPVPPPPPAPTVQDQAAVQVQQLADSLPAQITQAQADAQTLSTLAAGQALTADQVAALQRAQQGWVQLLPALQALVTATGLAPPATP
jgi:hypothetical protein